LLLAILILGSPEAVQLTPGTVGCRCNELARLSSGGTV
jgi:hypothetical protein